MFISFQLLIVLIAVVVALLPYKFKFSRMSDAKVDRNVVRSRKGKALFVRRSDVFVCQCPVFFCHISQCLQNMVIVLYIHIRGAIRKHKKEKQNAKFTFKLPNTL